MRLITTLGVLFVSAQLRADDWPQYLGPNRDGVWRETGIIERFPTGGPKVKWRAPLKPGYSGPAVVGDRVYVADFDSNTDPKLETYKRTDVTGSERLLCLDAATGKVVWKHQWSCRYTISFPNGPRCTPAVTADRVFMVGAEGDLVCCDAKTGKELWHRDFKKDYRATTPLWGFAGHPLVDGELVYVITGGESACVVALQTADGKERWRSLNAASPGYGCPRIMDLGGKKLLVVWHGESVNALDPASGKRIWSVPLKPSNGASIMIPVVDGELMFAGGYDGFCKGIRIAKDGSAATAIWDGKKKETGVYPINSQPYCEDGLVYGNCTMGELRCVDMATGKRLWSTLDPLNGKSGQCNTVFLNKNGDRFFLFNDQGELIIARLSRDGYREIDRAKIIEPTGRAMGRDVVYCAPAFAGKCMYVRNDKEMICLSMAKD